MTQPLSEHGQQRVDEIDNEAADNGDGKESQPEPGCYKTNNEGDNTGKRGERGLDDGREGHHSKGDVGNVIEETPQEGVADRPLDQQHGQDANQVCDQNRQ